MTAPHDSRGTTPERARLVAAHRAARDFYRHQLLAADGPRRYLTDRGLAPMTRDPRPWMSGVCEPWYLGYAPPGWTTLVDHLTAAGFRRDELVASGLAQPTRRGGLVDVFRDRVMFPIHNTDGDPVAFLGRAAPAAPSDVPKYLNTSDTPIYHKRQTLYGLGEQANRNAAAWAPVIVEGPIDVLAVWLAHPDGAGVGRFGVAACGTSLAAEHAATITALPGAHRHGVTTAYDNDPAGRAATIKAWQLLPVHPGIDLRAATLPDTCDPADLITRPGGIAQLRGALSHQARPLVQAVIDIQLDQLLARHPDAFTHFEGQLTAVRYLAGLLTDLPAEQVVALADHIARRIGVGMDLVADAVVDRLEQQPAPPPASPDAPGACDGPAPATPPSRRPPPERTTGRGRAFPASAARPTPVSPVGPHPVAGVTRPRRGR